MDISYMTMGYYRDFSVVPVDISRQLLFKKIILLTFQLHVLVLLSLKLWLGTGDVPDLNHKSSLSRLS